MVNRPIGDRERSGATLGLRRLAIEGRRASPVEAPRALAPRRRYREPPLRWFTRPRKLPPAFQEHQPHAADGPDLAVHRLHRLVHAGQAQALGPLEGYLELG